MTRPFVLAGLVALTLAVAAPFTAQAQSASGPLKIEITDGVVEPVPVAISPFITRSFQEQAVANDIVSVIAADLEGTGLFRAISAEAFVSPITNIDSPVAYSDWQVINAQALVSGDVSISGNRIEVKFRLFDVFAQVPLGDGVAFAGATTDWRRMAHKVADAVYARITGEAPYFDSQVVFVAESGPKNARVKRLAIMDYDGANVQNLTDGSDLVLAPRLSPDFERVLYTSYATGFPKIYEMTLRNLRRRALDDQPGIMTFAPRYSPDGRSILFSLAQGGNTDLYRLDLASGTRTRLTSNQSIETAPSFSPDGSQIVFESDRSGQPQLYVMPAEGGTPRRISFGQGRYGTPVWSPTGRHIAFTKQNQGRFHIGVMRPDGSEERLLTASFLDEAPTWAPNGRVLLFTREAPGANSVPRLYTVDITGRNLRALRMTTAGSDAAWGPIQN